MAKLRVEAMPRIPKLPEGISWEFKNPGYYHFIYPWPGRRHAEVFLELRRDDFGGDEGTGPWRWFWFIIGKGPEDVFNGLLPDDWANLSSDGGFFTLADCLANALANLEYIAKEMEKYDQENTE